VAHSLTRPSLGQWLRAARIAKGRSLRELARNLQLTPSYLSDIENDRRVPAEQVLRNMAAELDVSFDELMALGGKLGDQAERYIKDVPQAATLFRRISEMQLTPEELDHLRRVVDRLKRTGHP
jgi:transcriptional regulator with XRE-family HTH domain